MQEQVAAGIMEPVPPHQTGEVVHYIPHQAVIREQAETTKMKIVYDCSSRADTQTPSLNDCLETGPPLQPLLFDILLRNRMRKHCVHSETFRKRSSKFGYSNKIEMHSGSYGTTT